MRWHPISIGRASDIVRLACAALAAVSLLSLLTRGATFHIDSARGDDRNDGLAPERAWRSFAPANEHAFAPSDQLLLCAGSRWEGAALQPRGSGRPNAPIRLGRYGKGPAPVIAGAGKVPAALRLDNQEYWEISQLEITNHAAENPGLLRGVEIHAHDSGVREHVVLRELFVHDVNGPPAAYPDSATDRKTYGGIVLLIDGDVRPTAWRGIRIEDCRVIDVSAIGIVLASSWRKGHRDYDPATWFPSRDVVIRNNTIERTTRNGLIVIGCVAPLIERNRFFHCAIEGSGNACFAFDCDDAVFQFNEAAYTKYNPGDHDAAGFDSDWNCRRTVFQYNYSHDNDYGFILLCSMGSGSTTAASFASTSARTTAATSSALPAR